MQPDKSNSHVDLRKQALDKWVSAHLGATLEGVPASADASFRRYFRYEHAGQTLVAMDAPPEQEDCRPFIDVAGRLKDAGVHVPDILLQDLAHGFLLLSDMGTQTWLKALTEANADDWYAAAIDTLITMQLHTRTEGLPEYDEALLQRELELFPQWYLFRHRDMVITGELRQRLDKVFDLLINAALAQPKVFVHRDYMPRNLMVSEPNPGVIDFQDAVAGPITYDVISLFKDAFLSWPDERVQGWLRQYHQKALTAGLPVPDAFDDFLRDCDLMGAQRHIKVIGIFARICHRDGKPTYLGDVPRFFAYLRTVIARRPELADLQWVLDEIEGNE